jgi:hypothetical protein
MPSTAGHGHGKPVPPHLARLVISETNVLNANPSQRCARNTDLLCIPLEGCYLELTQAGSLNTTLPEGVVNVYPSVGRLIDPALVGPNPDTRVVSRVTMAAGDLQVIDPGEYWRWLSPDPQRVACLVQWTLTFPSAPLQLQLIGFNGGVTHLTLAPVGNSTVIDAAVMHVPKKQLPPNKFKPLPPDRCEPSEHFQAFYNVFHQPTHRPVPIYWGVVPYSPNILIRLLQRLLRWLAFLAPWVGKRGVASARELRGGYRRLGDPYSCVVASAELQ